MKTTTEFASDMHRAYTLAMQVAYPSRPITLDVVLVNATENFTSRNTRARIWVSEAVKLCKRHGVAIPTFMRRVTAGERKEFAGMLSGYIVAACENFDPATGREYGADDCEFEITYEDETPIYFTPSLNTRLTPAKLVRTTHFQGVNQMFQRLAIIASILAICIASVSCVAHTVYTF